MNKNIIMLVFSVYPGDPRVKREAEALVEKGYNLSVICLNDNQEKPYEIVNQVEVFRLPLQRKRKSKLRYIYEYSLFIFLSFFKLTFLYFKKKPKIVHVHNMPDILIIAAFIPWLFGSKIILDLHDPTPEVYIAKYHLDKKHPIIRILIYMEKFSIWMAHHVFTPNIAFKDLFVERGNDPDKITILMNSPQEEIFQQEISFDEIKTGSPRLMYHGSIVERHGLDDALHAMNILKEEYPKFEFHVYGAGDYVDSFIELIEKLSFKENVFFHGAVFQELLPKEIAKCDIGIISNKRNPFTEINLPTRIFEYICMDKPVIVPKTKGIQDYFDADSIFFFEPNNPDSLASMIKYVYNNPEKVKEVLEKGKDIYEKHSWEREKHHLNAVVDKLIK